MGFGPLVNQPIGEDARTLSIKRNSAGQRHRSLREAIDECQQSEFDDWPVEGPRTTLWYCRQVAKTGQDIAPRHVTWRHENNIKEEQRVAEQHEALSEVLDLAVQYDQLDVSNLACLEAATRRLQYYEAEERKKQEAKRDADGSEWFLGRSGKVGGNLVSPDLEKHVAERAARKASILKEQRKAQEERQLLRKDKKVNKE